MSQPVETDPHWQNTTRELAEPIVARDHKPILRPSTQPGKLALTYWSGSGVKNTLVTPSFCFPVAVQGLPHEYNSIEEIPGIGTPATNEDPVAVGGGRRRKTAKKTRRTKRH